MNLALYRMLCDDCMQVQLQLAALKRRAVVRSAKLAAAEAAAAARTGQAQPQGAASDPQHQQHRQDPTRVYSATARHEVPADSSHMGASEAAASVASAFELRQQPARPGWSSALCGDDASAPETHVYAASRAGPTEHSSVDARPDGVADEHCWQASAQYTEPEAGEETASPRPRVPSGGEHLRHQLDGLRRKKQLRAQVGADEV